MTLGSLIQHLEALRAQGATDESPVLLEGHDEDDHLVQAYIDGVMTESRCEEGAQGVYLNLSELSIG